MPPAMRAVGVQWRHDPPTPPHAVYDTLYHLVWAPQYRRDVFQGAVQRRVQELCADIAEP